MSYKLYDLLIIHIRWTDLSLTPQVMAGSHLAPH